MLPCAVVRRVEGRRELAAGAVHRDRVGPSLVIVTDWTVSVVPVTTGPKDSPWA